MNPKRIGIIQPNYVPWKGYFDFIGSVDAFVLLDDVQFTRRDWRNRNKIKTAQGVQWITIPVEVKGKYDQAIDQTQVADSGWVAHHLITLEHAYRRAGSFNSQWPRVRELYESVTNVIRLSEINRTLTATISRWLGIKTPIFSARELGGSGTKNERLISICKALDATSYLSGPAARAYMDEAVWTNAGITVEYKSYEGYPEYPQLHGPFEHGVSILDLLLNVGDDAANFITPMAQPDSRS
jgi:hypothetical protein